MKRYSELSLLKRKMNFIDLVKLLFGWNFLGSCKFCDFCDLYIICFDFYIYCCLIIIFWVLKVRRKRIKNI